MLRVSKMRTRAPRRASSRPMAQPMIPAPTTTTSGFDPTLSMIRGSRRPGSCRARILGPPRFSSMPRRRRCCPPGAVQHVLSRGNDRKRIFHKRADYWAFLRLMAEAQTCVPLPVLAYCVMPNHFHLVVQPDAAGALSAYMHWLLSTHVRRYHQHYGSTGTGHLFQGRYKNFLVQPGQHLLNVLRYVEANALRANLVRRAEDWTWSSLATTHPDFRPTLSPWPTERPAEWRGYVNGELALEDLLSVRRSVVRGAPYGDDQWTSQMAVAHGLESTRRRTG